MSIKKNNKEYLSIYLYITWIILAFSCLFIPNSNAINNPSDTTNTLVSSEQMQMAEMERQIITAATQSFNSSLEMKENVEFILTPALLVQESMSNNIIITYPSE